jgi:Flp pilus assembly protein TadG
MGERCRPKFCFVSFVRQKWGSPERGQELVEYALVFPLLFLLLFGLLEVGLIAYSYNTIANAARAGARYGIIYPDDAAGIESAVRSELYTRMISETATITSAREGDWIRVEVSCPITLVTGAVIEAFGVGPTLELRAVSRMPIE